MVVGGGAVDGGEMIVVSRPVQGTRLELVSISPSHLQW